MENTVWSFGSDRRRGSETLTDPPQTTFIVTTRCRPKRVAFVVDPMRVSKAELDEILRYSFSVWGGRFHAIVPSDGTDIAPDWWQLLVLADPDILYSLVRFDGRLVQRINRVILPSRIIEVTDAERARRGGRVVDRAAINAIGIAGVPRALFRKLNTWENPVFLRLPDAPNQGDHATFLLRNFGVLGPTRELDAAFQDVPQQAVDAHSIPPDELLRLMAYHGGRAVCPVDLCAAFVPRDHVIEDHPDAEGFHLVIGNTPLDWMYAWNRALVTRRRAYPGVERNTLWLPPQLAGDGALLVALSPWLERCAGPPTPDGRMRLVSYSADDEQLRRLAGYLTERLPWRFEPMRLDPVRFPCPRRGAVFGGRGDLTLQVPFAERQTVLPVPRPPFPVADRSPYGWMVDVAIQDRPERYTYTNLRPDWRLPKRLGLAAKFFQPERESRVLDDGLPSAAVGASEATVVVRVPTDEEIVHTLLEQHTNRAGEPLPVEPTGRFSRIAISDGGRKLAAVIELFGGLYEAGSTFADPFWRYVLLTMAGRTSDAVGLLGRRAAEVIRQALTEAGVVLDVPADALVRAAEKVARRLDLGGERSRALDLEDLKRCFNTLRGRNARRAGGGGPGAEGRWGEEQEADLHSLLTAGVLLQGAELLCPACGTRHWYLVDELATKMRCRGCTSGFSLPPTPRLSFRLNELVASALRVHGTLPVLQALYREQLRLPRAMFLWLPSQEIYRRGEDTPFTDLDLIVVRDRRYVLGEVKSHPAGFRGGQLRRLEEVTRELRPDVVLIAAPGQDWPEDVAREIGALRERLSVLDIQVEPVLLVPEDHWEVTSPHG